MKHEGKAPEPEAHRAAAARQTGAAHGLRTIQRWPLKIPTALPAQTAQAARDFILRDEKQRSRFCDVMIALPLPTPPARPCARGTQRATLKKCGAREAIAVWTQRRPRMKSRKQYLSRWGCQEEQHHRKLRHARAPGAATMCCTSRSFARNTATIRPDKLGPPMPTADAGHARECAPRTKS